jgi:hypothetical protein
MEQIQAIIASWDSSYGVADQLRCAAMEIQDDHPDVDVKHFVEAAAGLGFNPNTVRCCWNYVKRQAA